MSPTNPVRRAAWQLPRLLCTIALLGTLASFAVVALSGAVPASGPLDVREDTPSASAGIPYPEGFRAWRHVKSEIVDAGHPNFAAIGGLHHIYANELAMAGYQGGPFADGSVIVFDVFEIASDPSTRVTSERARRSVWVMHKDAQRHAATGGWGFEIFKGDSKSERTIGAAPGTACYGCHAKPAGGVFSRYRP